MMNQPSNDTPEPRQSSVESTLLTLAVLGVVVLLLSVITFVPRATLNTAAGTSGSGAGSGQQQTDGPLLVTDDPTAVDPSTANASDGNSTGSQAEPGQQTPGNQDVRRSDPAINCTGGNNGGSTDTGVTASSIKLGASTVDSGPGASFLHPVVSAMRAVVTKTNGSGGVCGRQLSLVMYDSGWNGPKGQQNIQNLIEGQKVFALAVNPDSEGLELATASGYIKQKKVPVVGTDGLLISQYQDPYIWPVAAPTVSATYAIAKSQCDAGLRGFSIVFETTYRFGREGAKAYNLAAKACTGTDIAGYYDPSEGQQQCTKNFCGIASGAPSYSAEVNAYCKGTPACTAGALMLEPATALVWLANGGPTPQTYGSAKTPGALGTPQPLFSASFANQCNRSCNQLRVWTGFNPPIEKFANLPAVQQYRNDVKAYDPSVDVDNQFVEGGYLGMLLLTKSLKEASTMPGGLTRANLVQVLDSTRNFDTGLTVKPLNWSKGNHFAETSVHAFDEQYGDNGFGGWRYTGLEITDPDPTAATR